MGQEGRKGRTRERKGKVWVRQERWRGKKKERERMGGRWEVGGRQKKTIRERRRQGWVQKKRKGKRTVKEEAGVDM